MNAEPEQAATNQSARPLWQWILLGVAPGLASDVLAAGAAAIDPQGSSDLGGLVMVALLGMPLFMLVYLIVLSKHYVAARGPQHSRAKFVIGFCLVNLFLWGGSCAMILSNLSFH